MITRSLLPVAHFLVFIYTCTYHLNNTYILIMKSIKEISGHIASISSEIVQNVVFLYIYIDYIERGKFYIYSN